MQWIIKKIVGTKNQRDIKKIQPLVDRINELEEGYQALSEEELKAKTPEFQKRLAEGETVEDLLCEAFAAVKNACRRLMDRTIDVCGNDMVWDMIPYDVQLVGGVALHKGMIAEMATGEGKTLVATLPVYLNALTGRGVHIITVNDYLAERDSEWMGAIYRFLGLSVGCLKNMMPPDERRGHYGCDITYGTNSEFGFDYLRDNMTYTPEEQVQRGHYFSVVDEIDSILIDEARTPLIISGPAPYSSKQYQELNPTVNKLVRKQRDLCTRLMREIKTHLEKEEAEDAQFKLYQVHEGMPKNKQLMHILEDPATRRLLEKVDAMMLTDMNKEQGRALREELYFTVDEKGSDANLTEKGSAAINPSDPESYVLPDLTSLIAEIDAEEGLDEEERITRKQQLQEEFALKSEKLHAVDQLIKAYCAYEKDVQYVVQDNQVIIVDENTGRMMQGRRWSDGLHQAVEAKEGVKIERETQTLATITIQNYFRMYDKLSGMTGTAETEADEFHQIYKLDVMVIPTNRPVRRMDYNDHIYKTQREKFSAVIEEIEKCHGKGQPILVGTISVETSELLSRMLRRRNIPHNVLNAKNHGREAEIVARAGQFGAVTIATNMAGRGTDIKLGEGVVHIDRELILSHKGLDDKIEGTLLRDLLTEMPSGLYVMGTERHESRRIDRQLRGRCARQGDPGASRFYISLEDDLMRLFGSDRISKIMERLGIEEGQVLEHPWLNKSIERAQRRVEQHNFSIRKRTLEYDDVMNAQRENIYGFRTEVLQSDQVRTHLYDMIEESILSRADEAAELGAEDGLPALVEWVDMTFPVGLRTEDLKAVATDPDAMTAAVMEKVRGAYDLKVQHEDPTSVNTMERHIVLQAVDSNWQEYLRGMDALRQGVGLRAYGQQDPLIEYKREAFNMFSDLQDRINMEVANKIFRSATSMEAFESFMASLPQVTVHDETRVLGGGAGAPARRRAAQPAPAGAEEAMQSALSGGPEPIRRDTPKVGRNDPCPCGSGKKYKKCCGAG